MALRASPGGGLYLFIAAVHVALLGFVLWRVTRRAAPPEQARESFDLAATAPAAVGGVIAPEVSALEAAPLRHEDAATGEAARNV